MNPYKNYNILSPDSDMFFNRKNEIEDILSSLTNESRHNISIYGETKIGKSSIAIKIFNLIKRMDDFKNTISVFINCSELRKNCSTEEKFFQELNNKYMIEMKPEFKKILNVSNSAFYSFESALNFFEKVHQKGLKSIIFLDDFERIYEKNFGDDFFRNLRSLSGYDRGVVFIIISRSHLKRLNEAHNKKNEFWNTFKYIPIGLFDKDNTNILRWHGFNKYALVLEDYELELMDYYAGGFPFLNQIICEHIFKSKINNLQIDRDKLNEDILHFYSCIWNCMSKSEQKTIKELQNKKYKKGEALELSNLKNTGLLKKANDLYLPFSEFFFKFLKSQKVDNNFDILKKIDMKEILEDFLKRIFNKLVEKFFPKQEKNSKDGDD